MAVARQQGPCFLSAGILSIGLAAAYYSAGEKPRLLPTTSSLMENGEKKESPSFLAHQGLASGNTGGTGGGARSRSSVCLTPSTSHLYLGISLGLKTFLERVPSRICVGSLPGEPYTQPPLLSPPQAML